MTSGLELAYHIYRCDARQSSITPWRGSCHPYPTSFFFVEGEGIPIGPNSPFSVFFLFCFDNMSEQPAEKPTVETGRSLPPGTVHLVDLEGNVTAKHADGQGSKDIILVPRPSEDPDDPLNWTLRRKLLATSCVVMYTIMLAIPSSAVYSIVTPIQEATGLSLVDLNNGTGIMVSSVIYLHICRTFLCLS